MFEKHKAHRAEVAAQRAAEATLRQAQADEAAWRHADDLFAWCADRAREVATGAFPRVDCSIALKSGEHALFELGDVGLVEARRGPGQWQGRTQGVSVHVPGTKSMRYRVGGTKGTYVQGDEKPTVIDTGTLAITTTRVVFMGAKQSREWAWSKLIGFHEDDPSVAWTTIAVSNRQKVSGISYPPEQTLAVRFYLQLGAAAGAGTANDMLTEIEAERAEHAGKKPAGIAAPARGEAEPGRSPTP